MIKRTDIRKSIRKIYKDFNTKYEFSIYKGDMLIRESHDILQIIYFKLARFMECEVVIQPLFMPKNGLDLTFGCELFKLNRSVPMFWDYTETMEEFNAYLISIKDNLEELALSWFNEVDSPEKLIHYIEKGLVPHRHLGFGALRQLEMLGYCYMYVEKKDFAIRAFTDLQKGFNPAFNWEKEKEEINNILSIINEGQPTIQIFLTENIENMKRNIKLK